MDIDLDSESSKRQQIFQAMKDYYGVLNVLNILTLRTEGTKSACLTVCRGFNIDTDTSQAIADMIPFERGANWSLNDCFKGNEEKGRGKLTEFIDAIAKHEGLKEAMFLIEGLVCGRSIHASGVYVFDNGYLLQNSRMKAPNGTDITCWTMNDSDYCGGLKIDVLTIQALDKIHITMDLLAEHGLIEQQPTMKETYNKYIHPDVLEYENKEMWEMLGENNLIDAFQFDTDVGSDAVRKVKPTNILDLAVANSLMRLMADLGNESPIDTYVKFKNNITLWYNEMRDFGLNEEDVKVVEKHLLKLYGVADTQEVVMQMVMDEKISGFDIPLANKVRKIIAKKKASEIDSMREFFYKKAKEINPTSKLAEYIWGVQIKRQLGYSFSLNHTMPYSAICVQEMNLAHRYNKIFWNTACLTVNAGADEDNDNNKTTQYGKIAKAISEIRGKGQLMTLPDINTAKFGFTPNLNTQEIIFGLKGICGIGDDTAQAIISNRPYTSLDDFMNKMNIYKNEETENKFGNSAVITLIKGGAFDNLEGKSRVEIMKDFILKISDPSKKLTAIHIPHLAKLNVFTKQQKAYEVRLYKFKKYACSKEFFVKKTGKSDSSSYYRLETQFSLPFFYQHFETNMLEDKDYYYDDIGNVVVKKGSLDREYDKLMKPFNELILSNPKNLDLINRVKFDELWMKHAVGTSSKWEMDALSFYYGVHELSHVNKEEYLISNFFDLLEVPTGTQTYFWRGKEKVRFTLCRICGTVLDTDKNKNTVTLLTPEGVVMIKYYKGNFGFYNKRISHVFEGSTTSKVLEEKWFRRGNKLLITGYRRGERFFPKNYIDSVYKHSTQLIKSIDENGDLKLQSERINVDELQ